MVSLRKFCGKKLVSFLRKGDFAHAGETEAIIKVMSRFPKNKDQLILDVGCGLGGTANYIHSKKWGIVQGIDVEEISIDYAREMYPEVEFYVGDVIDIDKVINALKFDVICMFNSFYAFKKQKVALQKLAKIAKKGANLAIFDYAHFSEIKEELSFRKDSIYPFVPIRVHSVKDLLLGSGWALSEVIDLTGEYKFWYQMLVNKLVKNKKEILNDYGEEIFNKAFMTYDGIYQGLDDGRLGGVIVYATKI